MPRESAETEPLLPRVARGDAVAVRECLTRYGGLVYSLVRRAAGTSRDVEDAVQDIFIEVWKQASRFDSTVATETTFISMIARRKLIDRYRRQRTQPQTESLVDLPATPAQVDIDWQDEMIPIRKLLNQLPDEQRRVLVLAVCDGWTHQEVADQTGLPLGTVKSYVRRGLMFIRDNLSSATIGGLR